MDSIKLCNAIRMEFEGIFENKIPLDAFPIKIQDMILAALPMAVETATKREAIMYSME